ncbi:MAG: hypothetical protein M1840_001752 [Geoglossum simile]|nr:MAG: hypothetical protein M1840_001752 [Geoglossum simile]
MSLLLPAEGSEYPNRKSMVEAIQAHAKSNGYAVTIQQSSNKDGSGILVPILKVAHFQFVELSRMISGRSRFEMQAIIILHQLAQLHIQFIVA